MPLCIAEDNNLAKYFFSLLKYISRLPAAQFTFPVVETNTLIKMGGKNHAEKESASVKRILRGLKWANEALWQPGCILHI